MNYISNFKSVMAIILSGYVFSINALPGDIPNTKQNLPHITTTASSLQNNYIDVNELLRKKADLGNELNFAKIKNAVLQDNKKYFIDFSTIASKTSRNQVKKSVFKQFDTSFDTDMVALSRYKGSLMYTPIIDNSNDALKKILASLDSTSKLQLKEPSPSEGDLPHVAFFINSSYQIKAEECTFKLGTIWDRGTKNLCDSPNINLIYKVTYARSLKFGGSGGAQTPDVKVVRISIDENSASGAGIHLNDKLDYDEQRPGYTVLDGWIRDWTTDAIAQDYKFTIQSSGAPASIVQFAPRNMNSNYQVRQTKTWEYGVSGGGEIAENPKVKLDASSKYQDQRALWYDTQDYRVAVNTPSSSSVSFAWEREQYATADSLLRRHTDTTFDYNYQIDETRVKPYGYRNFVPNLDVVYNTRPDMHGDTTFEITSSVLIRPIYSRLYTHYYVIGAHHEWSAPEVQERWKRINVPYKFTVNWDHPVFTGGRPVNLQLGASNNLCINVNLDKTIGSATCELTDNVSQAFIYDSNSRYVSVLDTTMCLDGSNLTKLNTCNANLSQVWSWKANSDEFVNNYSGKILANDQGKIYLAESGSASGNNKKTLTRFINVFNMPTCKYWDDSPTHTGKIGDIYMYPRGATNDFFRLKTTQYWYFPTNQTDNKYWQYLGHANACIPR